MRGRFGCAAKCLQQVARTDHVDAVDRLGIAVGHERDRGQMHHHVRLHPARPRHRTADRTGRSGTPWSAALVAAMRQADAPS